MYSLKVGGRLAPSTRFGQAVSGWENLHPPTITLFPKQLVHDLFTLTLPHKPAVKAAEQNPALLVDYFKQVANDTDEHGNPHAKLTLEDSRIMLPYFLQQARFPKSAIEHCIAEPAEDTIHLIISEENNHGKSNVPALVNAIDLLQHRLPDFKTISTAWTGSPEIPYNALTRSFMFLGYRVNTYEGLDEYLDQASYHNVPSFWGTSLG